MSNTLSVDTSIGSHAVLRNGLSYVTKLQISLDKDIAMIEVVNSQGTVTTGFITVDREAIIKMAQKILTQDYKEANDGT